MSDPKKPPPRAPSDPNLRATVRTSVDHVDHALDQHERKRADSDTKLAADQMARHEERRRASIVDRHEKDIAAREGALEGFSRHVEQRLSAQDQTLVLFARALGIEDQLPSQIRKSTAPPPMEDPARKPSEPPPPRLEAIEASAKGAKAEAKAGTQATYVTLVTTIALIVLEALKYFSHGLGDH